MNVHTIGIWILAASSTAIMILLAIAVYMMFFYSVSY